jgi:6-pyruvoyltetrahydropterin/6-carboxytetrahydropterin synthase
MFEISVTGRFTAAHQLRLADQGLEPLHEHNWRVMVTTAGHELDDTGVLLDFSHIQSRLTRLLGKWQHGHLNRLPEFASRAPSAEHVAIYIAEQMGRDLPEGVRLRCVEVEEAPGCVARYFPGPS